MADPKSPSKQLSRLEETLPSKSEAKKPVANPKPLPKFNSVLRPTKKPSANASIAIRPNKPFSAKIVSDEVAATLSEPKSFAPFKPNGKFIDAAKSADEKELDSQLSEFRSGSPTKAFESRIPHSKPRFKQVVQPDRRRNELSFTPKSELEDLMNQDYLGGEPDSDNADLKDTEKPLLQIEGLVPTLLSHQGTGVKFMTRRENARKYVKGGLLADDMGLGKTIQSIALILNCPPMPKSVAKSTLVVMPLALLDQWRAEINTMAPRLSVIVHHGPKRTKFVSELMSYDVVITNYDTVKNEHKNAGPLATAEWYRVIADEAHEFRNANTTLAKAMIAVKSQGRRWVLTGTPIHNKLGDLYTLFSFIGVPKMDYIDKESTKRLLKTIMLRRTQRVLAKLLPPIQRSRLPVSLSDSEMSVYNHYQGRVKRGLDFKNLTRLRQSCDGFVSMLPRAIEAMKVVSPVVDLPAPKPEPVSEVTLDEDEDDQLSEIFGKLSISSSGESEKDKDTFPFDDNSKVKAVRELLNEDRTRVTVIFSSFVVMLHVLVPMLQHEGISHDLYYGGLTAEQRQEMLARFKDPKSGITVLLCSLKAAAVGLNLVSASQVIMVEPWWNPQIVDQAVKRVHRLGQTTEVRCIELYAPDTVEDRMLTLQDKKRELAKHFMDNSDKLTKEEIRYLWTGESSEGKENTTENTENTKPEPANKDPLPGKLESPLVSEKPKNYADTKVNAFPKMKKHIKFESNEAGGFKNEESLAESLTVAEKPSNADTEVNPFSKMKKHSKVISTEAGEQKNEKSIADKLESLSVSEKPSNADTKVNALPKMKKHIKFES